MKEASQFAKYFLRRLGTLYKCKLQCQHCKTSFIFVPFQALVSLSPNGKMLYFDDAAKDLCTPTYSWKEMNICSPFDGWGIMIANLNSEGQAVAASGTLYVGAIIEDSYVICSRYNMDTRRWEDLDNGTETFYDNSDVAEPSMIELDGYIYVIGGNDYESCRSINKYDIANNCWVDCCNLKSGVAECSLVIVDKKVLILDTKRCDQCDEHNAIIQMYDPSKNESFVVLDDTGLETDCLENEDLQLTVQSGSCYVICDPVSDPNDSDGESGSPKQNDDDAIQVEQNPQVFAQNPRVFKLVCNFDSNPPCVVLGEEIPQTHPHRNNYIRAFCIEDKTFVNVCGCAHKIKDGIVNEDDLEKWRNITKTSFRAVHFIYDKGTSSYYR